MIFFLAFVVFSSVSFSLTCDPTPNNQHFPTNENWKLSSKRWSFFFRFVYLVNDAHSELPRLKSGPVVDNANTYMVMLNVSSYYNCVVNNQIVYNDDGALKWKCGVNNDH